MGSNNRNPLLLKGRLLASNAVKTPTECRKRRQKGARRKIRGTDERPRLVVHRSNNNISAACIVGREIAKICINKGINKVVFDRAGYLYHGRIKALADAAREGGLLF